MKGEILSIETVQEITETKRIIERLTRDKNLCQIENKELVKKVTRLDMENHNLSQMLEKLETYLLHRMKLISDKNDSRYSFAVLELKILSDALIFEKEKLLNKEVEEDE